MVEQVQDAFTERDRCLVNLVTGLPHKILENYSVDGLSQMVLHDLSHDQGFALNKATYLVDNPDFDHLLGVAGYDHSECHFHKEDIWSDPAAFKTDMEKAEFHQHIRKLLGGSFKRKDINLNDADDVRELGKQLGLAEPSFFSWKNRYGNHGLFLYEKNDKICLWRHGLLKNISGLLSMCNRG